MIDSKPFWLFQNVLLSGLWLAAFVLFATGYHDHWIVRLAELGLVVHLLEIPFVFRSLRARGVSPGRIYVLTILYGFTWWIPVSRGLYAVA